MSRLDFIKHHMGADSLGDTRKKLVKLLAADRVLDV